MPIFTLAINIQLPIREPRIYHLPNTDNLHRSLLVIETSYKDDSFA